MYNNEYNQYDQRLHSGYQNSYQINPQYYDNFQGNKTAFRNNLNRSTPAFDPMRQNYYIKNPGNTRLIPAQNSFRNDQRINVHYSQGTKLSINHLIQQKQEYIPNLQLKNVFPSPNSIDRTQGQQKNQLLIEQFKLTIKIVQDQNSNFLERLRNQNKKLIQQFKFLKSLIISEQLNISHQSLKNICQNNTGQIYSEILRSVNTNLPQKKNLGQQSGIQSSSKYKENPIINSKNQKISSYASILQKKIKSLNEKKIIEQKIKIQNTGQNCKEIQQKNTLVNQISKKSNIKLQQTNLNIVQNLKETNQPQKIDKNQVNQHIRQEQSNNDNQSSYSQQHPLYPADFSGEQSYLVDQQVQKREKQKSISEVKNPTFGMVKNSKQSTNSYHPKSFPSQKQLKRQEYLISQFFSQFLCPNLSYAPKTNFKAYQITKANIILLYFTWRSKKLADNDKPTVQKKQIQKKLTNEFKTRFSSCLVLKKAFCGIKINNNLTPVQLQKLI